MVNVWAGGSSVSIGVGVMGTLGVGIIGAIVVGYRGYWGKLLDFGVGLCMFAGVNQYVMLGLLGAKILITAIVPFETPVKQLKLCV